MFDSKQKFNHRMIFYALAALMSLNMAYFSYRVYHAEYFSGQLRHETIISGTENAFWQYRILIHHLAESLKTVGLNVYHSFALFDLLSLFFSLHLLLYLWSNQYRKLLKTPFHETLFYALSLLLVYHGLFWSHYYYQVPYTLPSLLYVMVVLYIVHKMVILGRAPAIPVISLFFITLLQTLNRSDVAFALGLGMFGYFLINRSVEIQAIKKKLIGLAILIISLSVSMQVGLKYYFFPTSMNDYVQFIFLKQNLTRHALIPFAIFMIPYLCSLIVIKRKDLIVTFDLFHTIIIASVCYFFFWLTVGKLNEVRIFIPFAVPVVHFCALYLVRKMPSTLDVNENRPDILL